VSDLLERIVREVTTLRSQVGKLETQEVVVRTLANTWTALQTFQSGIRLPNAVWLVGRNAANDADVNLIRLNASNRIELGASLEAVNVGAATGAGTGQVLASGKIQALTSNLIAGRYHNEGAGNNEVYYSLAHAAGAASNNDYEAGFYATAGDGVQPGNSAFAVVAQHWNGSSYVLQEAARFLNNGNVLIGTTTDSGYKLDVNGTIHYTSLAASSDVRLKTKIEPIGNALALVNRLRGVRFEWNERVNRVRDGYKLGQPTFGLIAQELETVLPELVSTWKLDDEITNAKAICYERLIPILVEAIKELDRRLAV